MSSWYTDYTKYKSLDCPTGVTLDLMHQTVLVADSCNHRVLGFSLTGVINRAITMLGGVRMRSPTGLAVDPTGNLYICESSRHRVCVVRPDGGMSHWFGRPGEGDGRFCTLRAIAVGARVPHLGCPHCSGAGSDDPEVFVVDSQGGTHDAGAIQVFTPAGQFLRRWLGTPNPSHISAESTNGPRVARSAGMGVNGSAVTSAFEIPTEGFTHPYGISIGPFDGLLYVCDIDSVVVLRPCNGSVVRKFFVGRQTPASPKWPHAMPMSLVVDPRGFVLVTIANQSASFHKRSHLEVYSRFGQCLAVVGYDGETSRRPSELEFWNPDGIAIHPDLLTAYVVDAYHNRIVCLQ